MAVRSGDWSGDENGLLSPPAPECGFSVRPAIYLHSFQPKHPLHDLARDLGARGLGLAQDAMPGCGNSGNSAEKLERVDSL